MSMMGLSLAIKTEKAICELGELYELGDELINNFELVSEIMF